MPKRRKTPEVTEKELQEVHELLVREAKKLKIQLPNRDNLRAYGLRFCLGCERVFPATLEYFRKNPKASDGLSARCRPCFRKRALEVERARYHRMRAFGLERDDPHSATLVLLKSFQPHHVHEQYARQGGRCFWCGQPLPDPYDVDHIVPLAKGGTNFPENICCSCHPCNARKKNLLPDEFIERYGLHHVTQYRGKADPSRDP